jgi:hypothetical protein
VGRVNGGEAGAGPAESRTRTQLQGDASAARSVAAWVFRGLAWLILAGLAVEVYLAGAGLFGVATFQPHRALGVALAVAILLLLALTPIARPGRRVVGLTALLAGLTVVQVLLRSLRIGLPWVAALHTLNAVAMAFQAGALVRAAPASDPLAAPARVGLSTQG